MDYETNVHDWRINGIGIKPKRHLQTEICALGVLYLQPLPQYQILDVSSPSSLDNKIIVTVRSNGNLIAFVSALWIAVDALPDPVLHSGITVIHEQHRRSSVKRLLFANLFLTVPQEYPQGIWIGSLTEIITSLVHLTKYVEKVYPSPAWKITQGTAQPSELHLQIAREMSTKHRSQMHISPSAVFDEAKFVFLGSNDWGQGRVFMRGLDDPTNSHNDRVATEYFKRLFRSNAGDEVLQVGFLRFSTISSAAKDEAHSIQAAAAVYLSKL
ncbi:hypothetical protein SCAR479_00111 [Seiridium cardinale]|uniref:Uncharacterized protein n=1 Tax=Seiridium cardinale TaxID=138064 RepID=A0ABR2Y8L0_9PEZI